jgi:hypothetical protein
MAEINVPRYEQRAYYVKEIEQLMAERGLVTRELICDELGLNPNTASAYLRHMHKDLRMIQRLQERKGISRVQWKLGEDFALVAMDDEIERGAKQHTVPARQIGMCRDSLVAALFGPALAAA